ncbi:hypothetical protein RGQ29_031991 [Quercus rubra]|uniref:Glycosyl transferase family 25 domain-containing protein n=1 Tax=Quercus rubra TaxID=3512 RepID=A0AAN7DTH6_QUERU|nr:hypothetical protein RGQ29_031991 [Quercus rubra]
MTTLVMVVVLLSLVTTSAQDDTDAPKLDIVMLVHPYNKINFLPFSLGGIEHQHLYPKDRINLIIRVGVYGSYFATSSIKYSLNQETLRILYQWVAANEKDYHKILVHEDIEEMNDDSDQDYWTANRFGKLMQIKERSLQQSIENNADFLLMMDADVILTNNFDKGYYVRTPEYMEIIERQKRGFFPVPMIHSCVLIDLRDERTHSLRFSPDPATAGTPFDDIISFAFSARSKSIPLFVNNEQVWGHVPPAVDGITNQIGRSGRWTAVSGRHGLQVFVKRPKKERLGFETIYIINLKRRPERRVRMEKTMEVIGLQAEFWDATDGQKLNPQTLTDMGITLMPGYSDPILKRPMTMGEVGCFLSHYYIWKDVVDKNYSHVIVLEDDVRFERNMKHRLREDLRQLDLMTQDFIYLGRKLQDNSNREELRLFPNFVRPKYSYWTIGYIITRSGAEKLIASDPLTKLLPVDEYLPLMYDQHPSKEWNKYYPVRNLKSLSIDPLLLSPSHYIGDQGYISDTEDSDLISPSNKSSNDPSLQSPSHNEL